MSSNFNQILNGKYFYKKNNQSYCEENFWVEKQSSARGDYLFRSEILSRSQNGEFLKVKINYLTAHDFTPKKVEISRFMGPRESTETFELEGDGKELVYFFFDGNNTQRFTQEISGVFQIATPAFSTSLLVSQKKRLEPLQRSQYKVITSSNIWTYEQPLAENDIYVQMVHPGPVDLKVSDQNLKATHCEILDTKDRLSDTSSTQASEELFLSKHFSIPYKGRFKDNIIIEIDQLNIT